MKKLFCLLFLLSASPVFAGPLDFTGLTGGADLNSQVAIPWIVTTGSTGSNPNFSNEQAVTLTFTALSGQNDRDGAGKKTFLPLSIVGNYYAAGQRFGYQYKVNCWGMGDCFGSSDTVTSAAGVSDPGGEGTAFRTMTLSQQTTLVKTTVSVVPAQTTCNTTITQTVARDIAPQVVTVASTTGCVVGDWITVDRGQIYLTDGNIEAVQITAVGSGTISGIFRHAHISGGTITPATLLTLASSNQLGEFRYLVNLTTTPVTTGTVSATSGTGITGSGTSWASNMVGGDTTLPGCIAMTSDDYTGSPFSVPNTLKSWYGIQSVNSATSINLAHRSAVGATSYSGNGAGAYTVRPCARILKLVTNVGNTALTNQIVLETNTFTWTVGNSVELAISVDGDVAGEYMRMAWFTPGSALRSMYLGWNTGAQKFQCAFCSAGSPTNLGRAFETGVSINGRTGLGIQIAGVTDNGAIDIRSRAVGDDKRITWGALSIGSDIANVQSLIVQGTSLGPGGTLSFLPPASPDYLPVAKFLGHLTLSTPSSGNQVPRLKLEADATNFISWQLAQIGLNGARSFQGVSSDYGTRPALELLSSGALPAGLTSVLVNSLNDATNTTNFGSSWKASRASVWTGTAPRISYFADRLTVDAGNNAHAYWEMRAGINASYPSNPVVLSVRDDGILKLPGMVTGLTGQLPLFIDAATGQVYAGAACN